MKTTVSARVLSGIAVLWGFANAAGAGPICMEAESAATVTPPVVVMKEAAAPAAAAILKAASGGACLDIPEGAGKPPEVGGEAVFRIRVPADGEYTFWGRVWWDDSCGNSLTIVADGGKPFAFGQDGTYRSWHWVKGMKVQLTTGEHEIRVQNREDGVRLDQILLTADADYVPQGIEPVTAAPAAAGGGVP